MKGLPAMPVWRSSGKQDAFIGKNAAFLT